MTLYGALHPTFFFVLGAVLLTVCVIGIAADVRAHSGGDRLTGWWHDQRRGSWRVADWVAACERSMELSRRRRG